MSCRAAVHISRRIDDSMKPDPLDNVWYSRHYKWPVYSFADAVQCHRETHHPTVYNSPDADLYVNLELDVRAVKAVIFLFQFFGFIIFLCSECTKFSFVMPAFNMSFIV
jgi:hypothetical protein